MLKRSILAAVLCVAVAAPTLAVETSGLKQLNQQIVSILAPFQNATTKASLVFKKVRTNDQHALDLNLNADYQKTGSVTSLELKLGGFHYHFGDGSRPWTRFNGSIGIDLTKVMSQDDINQMIPDLQSTLQDLVKEFAEDYGDAAQVTVKISNEQKDAQGNYVSLDAKVRILIDLDKLPQSTPRTSVPFTEASVKLSVNVTQGIALRGVVFSNPEYSDFQSDQQGLKEYLDNLLKQDAETLQDISSLYQDLDDFAGQIVNGQQKL